MNIEEINFFPSINLVISNNCRMKCKFCCASEEMTKKKSINTKNLFKIIDILHENGTKRICFTGGEPLLCQHINKLLKYSYNYGIINTIMSSDGKLINKSKIRSEYIDTFWLSIHGLKENHNSITCIDNSFEELEKAIINNINNYPFAIWSVITNNNSCNIENFINWSKNLGIKKIYLSNINETGKGKEYVEKNGKISNNDFSEKINELEKKYNNIISISGQKFNHEAQCVLIYDNGDIYLTPWKNTINSQKKIGNLLDENPIDVFNKIKLNKKIWTSYISRYENSSLFNTSTTIKKNL